MVSRTPVSQPTHNPTGTLVVLGMHRSGTSLVAEIAQRSGYHPPDDLLAPHPEDNPRGYFESSAVVKLNNHILKTLGMDWKHPQPLPEQWQQRCLHSDIPNQISQLISQHFEQHPSLLLKDPRLSRLLPLWLPALREHGCSLRSIHVLRRTNAVIDSLQRRHRTQGLTQASINSPQQIALLWLRYNLEAQQHVSTEQSLTISYEALLSQPAVQLQRLAEHLQATPLPHSEQTQLIQPRPAQTGPPVKPQAEPLSLDAQAMLDSLHRTWTNEALTAHSKPERELDIEQLIEAAKINVPEPTQQTESGASAPVPPAIAAAAIMKHLSGSLPRYLRAKQCPPQWLYLTDEPTSAHAIYRVKNPLDALNRRGQTAGWTTPTQITNSTPIPTSGLIVHRCRWTPALSALIAGARRQRVPVAFDIDDWLLDPAVVEQGWFRFALEQGPQRCHHWLETIASYRRVALECDVLVVPTTPLAQQAHSLGKPTLLLPNGYSPENLALAEHWRKQRPTRHPDGLFHLGYASGSPTHDADFATIVAPLQQAFAEHPQLQLTLIGHLGQHNLEQLPAERVKTRPRVAHINLAYELAQLDLNLAPLEANPFCDGKSPLKYFEAALVGVPSLGSANPVYRQQITHQRNGLLAQSPDEWLNALHSALQTDHASALGSAANTHAVEAFHTDQLVDRWLQHLAQADLIDVSTATPT